MKCCEFTTTLLIMKQSNSRSVQRGPMTPSVGKRRANSPCQAAQHGMLWVAVSRTWFWMVPRGSLLWCLKGWVQMGRCPLAWLRLRMGISGTRVLSPFWRQQRLTRGTRSGWGARTWCPWLRGSGGCTTPGVTHCMVRTVVLGWR